MSLHAVLRADGRLTDIRDWSDAERAGRSDLVPLRQMPGFVGPYAYDAATLTAVPATRTPDEKADGAALPVRVLAALVIEARPTAFTSAERARAASIIDAAALKVREAIRA
jgi:hypothetical protein